VTNRSVPRRRILVVEHTAAAPLGNFGAWLSDAAEIDTIRPHAGDAVPETVDAALIVLGGPMSAPDDAAAPWLPDVRRLLVNAVSDDVPTLGICLGAQLLALACGGTVEVGSAAGREAGVIDVRWTSEATNDRLVGGLVDPYPAASMHVDAVSRLPAGAVWLAASERYPHQAFRVGRSAWGLQFHPEVTLAAYRSWAHKYGDVDAEVVVADFCAREAEVSAAARQLADRFAQLVA
jgi:GMP synthase (glutamine-hydrolysing)